MNGKPVPIAKPEFQSALATCCIGGVAFDVSPAPSRNLAGALGSSGETSWLRVEARDKGGFSAEFGTGS